MGRLRYSILPLLSLLLSNPGVQAGEITRQQAGSLMQTCQSQRHENIAPLKAKEIEDCVTRQGKQRDYCERFNRNYGERTVAGTQRGLFWDLPACQDAIKVEQYFKKYPGRKVYTDQ
jgi:hypothetical protein